MSELASLPAGVAPTDHRRAWEIAAIFAIALGRLLFMVKLGWRLPFIAVVTLAWAGYVYYRLRAVPGLAQYWGWRTDNFWGSFWRLLPIGIGCAVLFLAYGFFFGTSVLDWTIVFIFITYPIWGILQQFLALGVFARNVKEGWGGRPDWQVILLTGGLFGLIHYPFPLLMAATFILGLAYSYLYLRGYNLIAMGIYHGWLGGLFFYTVLGRNSFLEAFG